MCVRVCTRITRDRYIAREFHCETIEPIDMCTWIVTLAWFYCQVGNDDISQSFDDCQRQEKQKKTRRSMERIIGSILLFMFVVLHVCSLFESYVDNDNQCICDSMMKKTTTKRLM
jgi:hypothetical protein